MTAVRVPSVASMAARSPAPPAPTMTASYVWEIVMSGPGCPLRRIEGEDDDRAQDEEDEAQGVEQHVQGEPRARRPDVVEDDHPQAVDAVDQREDEQRPIPRPPNRALPARRDEAVVDARHAAGR